MFKNSDNPEYCQDVETAIACYEKAAGHFAVRTRAMIQKHGNIGALELLMYTGDIQKGFRTLASEGKKDKTFEAVLVNYQHKLDIDKKAVECAVFRLSNPQMPGTAF